MLLLENALLKTTATMLTTMGMSMITTPVAVDVVVAMAENLMAISSFPEFQKKSTIVKNLADSIQIVFGTHCLASAAVVTYFAA